ncbi:MAG: hypothetical protein Q4G65_12925 [bacterium]|nr:hypothetical protein [bacterium]
MQSKTRGTYMGTVAVLCLLSGTVLAEESAALFADGRGRSLGPFECATRFEIDWVRVYE